MNVLWIVLALAIVALNITNLFLANVKQEYLADKNLLIAVSFVVAIIYLIISIVETEKRLDIILYVFWVFTLLGTLVCIWICISTAQLNGYGNPNANIVPILQMLPFVAVLLLIVFTGMIKDAGTIIIIKVISVFLSSITILILGLLANYMRVAKENYYISLVTIVAIIIEIVIYLVAQRDNLPATLRLLIIPNLLIYIIFPLLFLYVPM